MAQTESMSLSQNVRMGIKSRMRRGTFKQGCLPYGFKKGADGWNIVENEARIVRVVFNAYLAGKSLQKIADELNEAGIPKKDGTVILHFCLPIYRLPMTQMKWQKHCTNLQAFVAVIPRQMRK